MPLTVNVQPDQDMTVQVVHGPMDPPSLLLGNGTTTVVLAPAGVPEGMTVAADFARQLVQAVLTWEQLCARQLTLASSADPFGVDDIVARLGLDSGGSG
jgi:hypothetical protein